MTTTEASARTAAAEGFRDLLPIIVGMAPFGLVAGIVAVDIGLPAWGAMAFSSVIFAGAAQIAAIDLLGQGAAVPIVIATIAIINARMAMYSASLAPHMGHLPLRRRVPMAYLLTDQAYAMTITKLAAEPDHPNGFAYYIGGALPLWVCWQAYTLIGALAGAAVPAGVPIDFAIPLVFAALLVPAVTDRPTLAAAVSSATVATLGAELPARIGLLAAALTGIAVGYLVSRRAGQELTA